jgi:uncharacterized ParB-like nuclease family protein
MTSSEKPIKVDLSVVRVDPSIQMRKSINGKVVKEYAEIFDVLPPLTVFHDGKTFWLADGFHRHSAAKSIGREQVLCVVKEGTKRDAILFACGANSTHGLRRSNEDKRRAVECLLKDEEWSQWSDRKIADVAGVSHMFVASVRRRAESQVETVSTSGSSSRIGIDGKNYPETQPPKENIEPQSEAPKADPPEPTDPPQESADEEWEEVDLESEEQSGSELFLPSKEPEVKVDPGIPEWKQNRHIIDRLRVRINELIRDVDDVPALPGFERLHQYRRTIIRDLDSIKNNIVGCTPEYLCPYCLGNDRDCVGCGGRGWLSSHEFKQAPKEMRDEVTRLSTGGNS